MRTTRTPGRRAPWRFVRPMVANANCEQLATSVSDASAAGCPDAARTRGAAVWWPLGGLQLDERARRLNSAPHPCHDCGCLVARQTGYRFYAEEGPQVLCASCYQQRLSTATGGRTHDLAAQVAG